MTIAAAILTRKEIVAVLIELNKKIDGLGTPNSVHNRAQLATYTLLHDHYLQQLLAMNTEPADDMDITNKVA